MSKAKRPSTPIPSRRALLTALSIPAALPVPALAVTTDPIFAAIDAFRRADAACVVAVDGNIPDEAAERWIESISAVSSTRPTTPAGLAALTTWARERADWLRANGTEGGGAFCEVSATIDDATRGMSGLEPWSPPAPVPSTPHPDAELFAAIERHYAAAAEFRRHWQAWSKVELLEPPPRGFKSKERAYLRSMDAACKTGDAVAAIQARTVDGLIAKANAANNKFFDSEEIKLSIADDVLSMAPSSADILPSGKAVA